MRHFPEEAWRDAARIAYLESGWRRDAVADTRYKANGQCNQPYLLTDGRPALTEWSAGYFQVNICAHGRTLEHWLNADNNVAFAAALYANRKWADWYYSARHLGLL